MSYLRFLVELYIVRLAISGCYVSQLHSEADLWSSLNDTDSLLPEDPAQTYLYPSATFNCSGFISSATYISLDINSGRNGRPRLVIYNNNADGTYSVAPPGSTPLDMNYTVPSVSNSSITLRIFYFYPPIPFVAGNVVSVHLPQASVEKYRLLFYNTSMASPAIYGYRTSINTAPTTFTITRAVQRTVLPALYLDLCTSGDQRYPICTGAISSFVTPSQAILLTPPSMELSITATSVPMTIISTMTVSVASTTPSAIIPSTAAAHTLPVTVIVGSIGGFVVAVLLVLIIIAAAFCVMAKHQSTWLDRQDEPMTDNQLYSCIHRDTLDKSSFVMPRSGDGSLPPLPTPQPSPYMQPESTMSQSDPPPLPPPFQYETPQSLDPKKHVYLSLDKDDDTPDSSVGQDGTPQSSTVFLTPDGSPAPIRTPLASYSVLQRIGSKHAIEPMDSLTRLTRLSSANSVFDDSKYNFLHEEHQSTHTPGLQSAGDPNPYWKPSHNMRELCAQLSTMKYRNILREDLRVTGHLGSGEFGTVQKGVWQHGGNSLEVAIKTLNLHATPDDRVRFLREAAIMGQFAHPNIIRLHGVITEGDPIMIVLELAQAGDLRQHLKSFRPQPGELLPPTVPMMFVTYCCEVALGMEYLARREFIHRDLAARNILLTENRVCKIADFGLSRDLEDENCYIARSGAKIPIKWTAPEAINFKRYSSSSDVWSYGVLLFEIWSLGHTPFSRLSVEDTIKAVDAGKRMPPPPGCPRAIYELMMKCWHPDASSRPTFTNIVETMTTLTSNIQDCCTTEDNMQAMVLGASLFCAENLYPDLQHIYERTRTQNI